jgi:hypothetical protein
MVSEREASSTILKISIFFQDSLADCPANYRDFLQVFDYTSVCSSTSSEKGMHPAYLPT